MTDVTFHSCLSESRPATTAPSHQSDETETVATKNQPYVALVRKSLGLADSAQKKAEKATAKADRAERALYQEQNRLQREKEATRTREHDNRNLREVLIDLLDVIRARDPECSSLNIGPDVVIADLVEAAKATVKRMELQTVD